MAKMARQNDWWVEFGTAAMVLVLAGSGGAAAGERRVAPSLKDERVVRGGLDRSSTPLGFYGYQRGCYWRKGQRICSRYCYWETDGYRYCQDKERYAFPQGDPWFAASPPEPPIYLRPPYARP